MTPSKVSILQNKPNLCADSNCALAKSGAGFTEVEIGSHYEATKLLCIGEASGENEARESLPFRPHAQAGSMFADSLRAVNISRAEIAITNIVRCFISPRTAVLTCGGYKAISKIESGELVLTHKGRFRRVLAPLHEKGQVDYLRILIGAGRRGLKPTEHRVTPDHRYLTESGWIFARNLKPGMCVMGLAETCMMCGTAFHRHFSHYQTSLAFCSHHCHNTFAAHKGKEKLRQIMLESYRSGERDRNSVAKAANAAMRGLLASGWRPPGMTEEGKVSHRIKSSLARQAIGMEVAPGVTWIGFGEKAVDAALRAVGHDPIPQFALEGYNYDFKVGNLLIEVDGPGSRNVVRRIRDAEKERVAVKRGYKVVHVPHDQPESVISLMDNDDHNYQFIPVEVKSISKGTWPYGWYSLQVEEDESFVAQGFVHHNCRPPKDWLTGSPYEYNAISNCTKNYLYQTIDRLKPRAILALGGTAMRALTASVKGKYGTLDYARDMSHRGEGPAAGIPVIQHLPPCVSQTRSGTSYATPTKRFAKRHSCLRRGSLVEGTHYALDLQSLRLNYQTAPTIDEAWEFADVISTLISQSHDIAKPL